MIPPLLSLILLSSIASHGYISPCRASPVSNRPLLDGEPIAKDWLTLATGTSSSRSNDGHFEIPEPSPQFAAPAAQFGPPLNKGKSLSSSISSINDKEQSRTVQSSSSKKSFKGPEKAILKKFHRKAWSQKYPHLSLPIDLMTQKELYSIGIRSNGGRHRIISHLEAEKRLQEGVQWPQMHVEWPQRDTKEPIVHNRFRSLIVKRIAPKDKANLVKKQAEVDKLLDDAGLLMTSNEDKKMASRLFVVKTRQKKKGLQPAQWTKDLSSADL